MFWRRSVPGQLRRLLCGASATRALGAEPGTMPHCRQSGPGAALVSAAAFPRPAVIRRGRSVERLEREYDLDLINHCADRGVCERKTTAKETPMLIALLLSPPEYRTFGEPAREAHRRIAGMPLPRFHLGNVTLCIEETRCTNPLCVSR